MTYRLTADVSEMSRAEAMAVVAAIAERFGRELIRDAVEKNRVSSYDRFRELLERTSEEG